MSVNSYPEFRPSARNGAFILWFSMSIVILLFVLLILMFPPMLTLGIIFALLFLVLLWKCPWTAIGLYMLAVLFSPDPKIVDVLTVIVYAILLGRAQFTENSGKYVPNFMKRPVFLFVAVVVFSSLLGVFYFRNTIPFLYRDGRVFLYWLWLPLLYFSFAHRPAQAVRSLTLVILFLGGVVAAIATFQFVTNITIVETGRVAELETIGSGPTNVMRVQISGFIFVVTAAVWTAIALRFRTVPIWLGLPLLALLGTGLLSNFGRALWFWTGIALLLSVVFIGRKQVWSYLVMGAILCALALATTLALKPEIVRVAGERIQSIKYEGAHETSLGWRIGENEDSMRVLKKSPLFGVGMGGEYRRWLTPMRNFEDHTRYVHNGYLFMALKLGIPGVAVFLYVFWRLLTKAVRFLWTTEGTKRVAFTTCLAVLPAALGLSTTQPEVMNDSGVASYALIVAWLVLLMEKAPEPLNSTPVVTDNPRKPTALRVRDVT